MSNTANSKGAVLWNFTELRTCGGRDVGSVLPHVVRGAVERAQAKACSRGRQHMRLCQATPGAGGNGRLLALTRRPTRISSHNATFVNHRNPHCHHVPACSTPSCLTPPHSACILMSGPPLPRPRPWRLLPCHLRPFWRSAWVHGHRCRISVCGPAAGVRVHDLELLAAGHRSDHQQRSQGGRGCGGAKGAVVICCGT